MCWAGSVLCMKDNSSSCLPPDQCKGGKGIIQHYFYDAEADVMGVKGLGVGTHCGNIGGPREPVEYGKPLKPDPIDYNKKAT